jgi:hypothetical protein
MGHRCSSVLLLGAVLTAGLVAPRRVAAEGNAAEAERQIRHGIELRKARDDEGAAREFQKAYDEVHTARAAGQLGLAEQALGRWEDAERHVREAIEAAQDPWVAKNHATLVDALGTIQGHLGRVEVNGDPDGAEVSINGRPTGKLPLASAILVSAGQVDVELRAPGYVSAQRTLAIVAGQYQRIVVHLSKETTEGEAGSDRAKVARDPGGTTGPVVPVQVGASPSDGPSQARVALKWTAAGLAGTGLAAGVTFTILHAHNVSAFNSHAECADDNGTAVIQHSTTPAPQCQGALDAYRLDGTLAIAGYIGAAVFATTWLILQLTEGPPAPAAPEHALSSPLCAPAGSGSGPGLVCAVRF